MIDIVEELLYCVIVFFSIIIAIPILIIGILLLPIALIIGLIMEIITNNNI